MSRLKFKVDDVVVSVGGYILAATAIQTSVKCCYFAELFLL